MRRRAKVNDDFFSQDTAESFYWAGFLAADGCVLNTKRTSVWLSKKDLNQIQKLKTALNYSGKISYSARRKAYGITVTSEKIVEALKRFNVVPRKSLILTFPEWLKEHQLVNHFLRGYFDGDGSFSVKSGKYVKTIKFALRGTVEFLNSFQNILNTNCKTGNKKVYLYDSIGSLEYSGRKKVSKIIDFLYSIKNHGMKHIQCQDKNVK